jgi:hypothetical protein
LNQIHVLFLTNKQKQQNCDYATKKKLDASKINHNQIHYS